MDYKQVKLLQDDTGDWYAVPEEIHEFFLFYVEDMNNQPGNHEIQDLFQEKFGKYAIPGDINNIQIYIQDDQE